MSTSLKIGLVLLLAIVLAVAARLVYNAQMAPAPPAEPQVRVWATAAALPAGLLLRDTDVVWQSYPETGVPQGAIVEGSKQAQLNGAVVRRNLPAGSVLTANDVILPQAPGFLSAALQPDMRAISVPVNDVSGNAGLIRPGDYVDLILTQDLRSMGLDTTGPQGGVVSETVVEHARVIAVGSEFVAVDERADGQAASGARTVTLEVSPRAAEAVAVAARLGTISLALRSFVHANRSPSGSQQDGAQVTAWEDRSRDPVWAGDVSRAMSSLPRTQPAPAAPVARRHEAPSAPARPPVTILRGSTAGQATVAPNPGF